MSGELVHSDELGVRWDWVAVDDLCAAALHLTALQVLLGLQVLLVQAPVLCGGLKALCPRCLSAASEA